MCKLIDCKICVEHTIYNHVYTNAGSLIRIWKLWKPKFVVDVNKIVCALFHEKRFTKKKEQMMIRFRKRDDNANNQASGSADSNSFILENEQPRASSIHHSPRVLYWIIVSRLNPFTISHLCSREYNLWQPLR